MLVDRHYGALYRFALSLTRHETDAADLTQQTFLVWARKGHQLRDRGKARTWLFTTLHRTFLETQRRAGRMSGVPLEESEWELPGLDAVQAREVDGEILLEALGDVDPVFRGAVALFYLEDLTYLEIAGILDIPLGTVKSRIARGVSQLQQRVAATIRPTSGRPA